MYAYKYGSFCIVTIWLRNWELLWGYLDVRVHAYLTLRVINTGGHCSAHASAIAIHVLSWLYMYNRCVDTLDGTYIHVYMYMYMY